MNLKLKFSYLKIAKEKQYLDGICVQRENGNYECACENGYGNFPTCKDGESDCDPSCEPKGECILAGKKSVFM